jgi:hydroxyacylglutathione hydrolase
VFFGQVLYRDLGCASYVLGDAGEAVVVDPRWDIDVYLEIARTERARITHIVVGSLQIRVQVVCSG